MVQRYKFESKSQRMKKNGIYRTGCFQWFKDTNLKVNHNAEKELFDYNKLFPMVQRYKFESKSQQDCEVCFGRRCCFQWFKDTNLKVNHNLDITEQMKNQVVSNGSKIQI